MRRTNAACVIPHRGQLAEQPEGGLAPGGDAPAARGVELVGRPTRGDFMIGLIAVR